MADLSWTSADLSNGTTADASKVQEKFDDIATFLNSTPTASAGIGADNIYHNYAPFTLMFVVPDVLPVEADAFTFRTTLHDGLVAVLPTRLSISQSDGTGTMNADDAGPLVVKVDLLKGTFGSESSMLTSVLSGTYNTSNAVGKVFTTTSFDPDSISGSDTVLFKVYRDAYGGDASAAQGTQTTICLYGQSQIRAAE